MVKFSHRLVPLVLFSSLAPARQHYPARHTEMSEAQNPAKLDLSVTLVFLFSLFCGLAIRNKKEAALHMRYRIAASFVVIGLH